MYAHLPSSTRSDHIRAHSTQHPVHSSKAYSPLGGGSASNAARASDGELDGTRLLLSHPSVQKVSEETGKTTAQVLLRWALQQDFMVIPRSSKPARIQENVQIFDFELSEEQVKMISASWLISKCVKTDAFEAIRHNFNVKLPCLFFKGLSFQGHRRGTKVLLGPKRCVLKGGSHVVAVKQLQIWRVDMPRIAHHVTCSSELLVALSAQIPWKKMPNKSWRNVSRKP